MTVVGNMWKSVLDNIASGSPKVQAAFQALGISMTTTGANGQKQLKPIWDLLMQLSQAAEHSTVAQTQYFSSIAGGKFQFDTLRAAVSNLKTIQDGYNTSLNSTGETLKIAQPQLNSLASDFGRLRDAIQNLGKDAGSGALGDALKTIVINVTNLINGLEKLPAGIGPVAAGFAVLLLAGKMVGSVFESASLAINGIRTGLKFWGDAASASASAVVNLAGATTAMTADLNANVLARNADTGAIERDTIAEEQDTLARDANTEAIVNQIASIPELDAALETEQVAVEETGAAWGFLDTMSGGLAILIGGLVVGAGALAMTLGKDATAAQQAADETQQLSSNVAQLNMQMQQTVSTGGQNIDTLQQLKDEYNNAQQALKTAKQGSEEYKKAQNDLIDVHNSLIQIVGKEAADQIMASGDVNGAINSEIMTMANALVNQEKVAAERKALESDVTNNLVDEVNKRIDALNGEVTAAQQAASDMAQANNIAAGYSFQNPGFVTTPGLTQAQITADNTGQLVDSQMMSEMKKLAISERQAKQDAVANDPSVLAAESFVQKLKNDINAQVTAGSGDLPDNSKSGKSKSSKSGGSSGGTPNQQTIWEFLTSHGLSDTAVAGIMGNIEQESGFSPTARNPQSGAFGIGQWLGSRLTALQQFARVRGESASSLDTQLQFMVNEMFGSEGTIGAAGGLDAFNAMSPTQAATFFEHQFERSGGSALGARRSFANQIFSAFHDSSKSTASGPSLGAQLKSLYDGLQQIDDNQLAVYVKRINDASDALDAHKTALQDDESALKSDMSSADAANMLAKEYGASVDALKTHENALAGEMWEDNQLITRVTSDMKHLNDEYKAGKITHQEYLDAMKPLQSEFDRLTSSIQSNQKAMASDNKEMSQMAQSMRSDVIDELKSAYDAEKQVQENALQNIYQPQIDALTKQKDAVDALIQSLQQQWSVQSENNKLLDLQNQLSAVEADKRFEIVGLDGKLTFTYDTAKAAELQKQISDEQTTIAHNAQIKQLEDQKSALDTQIKNLQSAYDDAKRQLDAYWQYRLSQDQLQQEADRLIVKEGYGKALLDAQNFANQMNATLATIHMPDITAGGSLASMLGLTGATATGTLGTSSSGTKTYSLADASGHVDTGTDYDALVNKHGGQWLDHKFVKGHYANGQFIKMASGGIVPLDMGIRGIDSVPAMLKPGEIVTPSWDDLIGLVKHSAQVDAPQRESAPVYNIHIDTVHADNIDELLDSVERVR